MVRILYPVTNFNYRHYRVLLFINWLQWKARIYVKEPFCRLSFQRSVSFGICILRDIPFIQHLYRFFVSYKQIKLRI